MSNCAESHNGKVLNILFLGGAKRVGMTRLFKTAGVKRGFEVRIFSYELDIKVPIALVGEVIPGLRWKDPKLYDHLHRVVTTKQIDIIIPFVDPAVEVAAEYAQRYGDAYCAACSPSAARNMFDKKNFSLLCEFFEIPVPRVFSLRNNEALYPLIAKPRTGSASKGIKILRDYQEVKAIENADDFLIQEYIANATEYSVDCYVDQAGNVLGAVPRRRIEVIGGEVSISQTEHNDEIERLTVEAIGKLGLTGPVTLQFLYDANSGRYLLMEINPRLGGGAVCSVHAGLPIPGWIIDEATGRSFEEIDDWVEGARMTRCFEEAVFAPDGKLI